MWLIFLATCIVVAFAGFALAWVGNKIYLSIKRDLIKFEKEWKERENTIYEHEE